MAGNVREFFDGYAEAFDDIYESGLRSRTLTLSRLLRRSMQTRFDLTFRLCRPLASASFLDLGCGSGQYAIFAAMQGAATVTGADFSTEMIALANRKAEQFSVADRCAFEVADVTSAKLAPHDYCVALGVFDYVAVAGPLLARMRELTEQRMVASFPKRWHPLTPQRKLRYRLRGCPLYTYGRREIDTLAASLKPFVAHVFDLGRDYLLTAAAP